MAWITADVFRWHLDYFRSPGPQFHRLAVIIIPAVAVSAWVYCGVRRAKLWRYEPYVIAFVIVGACLAYEPAAFLMVTGVFLACSAVGRFVLRRVGLTLGNPLERLTLTFGAGAGLLIFLLFLCGMFRLFYAPVFAAILVVPLLVFWSDIWRTLLDIRALFQRWQSCDQARHPLAGVAVVFGFLAMLCSLMVMLAPSIAFDPVAVHIPSARFYAEIHALRPVTGITYSYYPQGFEMLWTFAYVVAGQAGMQLISGLFFPLFLVILTRLARECGLDHGASLLAAICAATLPFLHWSGSVVKNDLALGYFELLALYSFVLWLQKSNFRWIVVGAFFLAQAASIKHVALFGAVPLLLFFFYAASQQSKRLRSAALIGSVIVVFAGYWFARAYLLTGNPVAPSTIQAASGDYGRIHPTLLSRALKLIGAPEHVLFHGLDVFESPLPNPAGILFLVCAPLALLGAGLRPRTRTQAACILFAVLYFVYWGAVVVKVRYAIAAFAVLGIPVAAWMKHFYDSQGAGLLRRLSIIGAQTYCLSIGLMGLMIVDVNAPQLAYFAHRLDKSGYLREAMQAYGPVEFLRHTGAAHPSVFTIENMARAYAPDPFRFDGIWCSEKTPCSADRIVLNVRRCGAEFLIVPDNGDVPQDALRQLGNPDRIYRDAHFSVYHLATDAVQALR